MDVLFLETTLRTSLDYFKDLRVVLEVVFQEQGRTFKNKKEQARILCFLEREVEGWRCELNAWARVLFIAKVWLPPPSLGRPSLSISPMDLLHCLVKSSLSSMASMPRLVMSNLLGLRLESQVFMERARSCLVTNGWLEGQDLIIGFGKTRNGDTWAFQA